MDHILGRKVGMTQVFEENGSVVPVTVIQAGPCLVTAVRTPAKDGYDGVQVAFEQTRKPLTKPKAGYFKKRNLANHRILREFRTAAAGTAVGSPITVEIFAKGDYVDVMGTTKGKGFQGGVKRYNFRGGPKTHGQSDRLRAPGSIGSGTTPGRVFKGMHMAGHMGNVRHTVLNLQIVGVDTENNVLLVKGPVPGADQGLVTIRRAIKKHAAK
jgi:large subunit ribosomal protein L3